MTREKKLAILKEARELFLPIPVDKFIKSEYTNGKDSCCAIGHASRLKSKNPNDYSVDNCYPKGHKFASKLMDAAKEGMFGLLSVNDGDHPGYQQHEVKDRVMAFLDDEINRLEKGN